MDTRIALGVNNAPINALGSFAQGEGQAAGVEASHLQHAKDTIEMVGAGAMHALNGDINGEVDPVKYGEVMDSFEQMGVDVSKFRDNPEFAKVAAHASVGALNEISQANNERDYKLIIDKWQKDLEQQGIENARADRGLDIQERALTQRSAPEPPNGYQFDANGGLAPIPGGPADPANPLNAGKGAGKLTAAERRNQQLSSVIEPELETIDETFGALQELDQQALGKLWGSEFATSEEYQRATNSLKTIVASYLYSVSGAVATDAEIATQTNLLTPKPGESKLSIADKLKRIHTMANAVKAASGPSGDEGSIDTGDDGDVTIEEVP